MAESSAREALKSLQKGDLRAVSFQAAQAAQVGGEFEVVQTLSKDASHAQVLELLPSNESRFAFFNLDYTKKEGSKSARSHIFFVYWCPVADASDLKAYYSKNENEFKLRVEKPHASFTTGSADELEYNALVEYCRKHYD